MFIVARATEQPLDHLIKVTQGVMYLRAENFATFQIILMGWQCINI